MGQQQRDFTKQSEDSVMIETQDSETSPSLISNIELDDFREKTDRLMLDLENNDIPNALKRINEINEINGKSFYRIIGKLTRGLHDAISDLSISSSQDLPENDKTRVDLNYVISLTDGAAEKTLDMTEQSRAHIADLGAANAKQTAMLEEFSSKRSLDKETIDFLQKLTDCCKQSNQSISQLNFNISEIVIAQNFQDIASQSITKAIGIIEEVEDSLVALTQYANLLTKISQFSGHDTEEIDSEDSEELKTDIGQFKGIGSAEHLDQSEVDNLLSSLGF